MSYVSFNIVSQSPDKPGLINVRFTRKSKERQTEEKRKRETVRWGRYSIQIFPLIYSGKNMRMGE